MEALLHHSRKLEDILSVRDDVISLAKILRGDPQLRVLADQMERHLETCGAVFSPLSNHVTPPTEETRLKAIAWNVERGKHFEKVLGLLESHPDLKGADFYLLTEVDWGMARTGNRNVTADLGKALGMHAYFAPSYYNLTKGHGTERQMPGKNQWGLHGKSILSRYPLDNLRTIPMPNATDKLNSEEARLGQKRALRGELLVGRRNLAVICAHLDAFSSPESRSRQLREVASDCLADECVLVGGDWNTNTLNSTSTTTLVISLMSQWIRFRPKRILRDHHNFPERHFDRPIFRMLKSFGFDIENCNEMGTRTYALITNDKELGMMARDRFPMWSLRAINRLIENAGGNISLKLDWYAAKNLNCLEKKVVKVPKSASDHHPIVLTFNLKGQRT